MPVERKEITTLTCTLRPGEHVRILMPDGRQALLHAEIWEDDPDDDRGRSRSRGRDKVRLTMSTNYENLLVPCTYDAEPKTEGGHEKMGRWESQGHTPYRKS